MTKDSVSVQIRECVKLPLDDSAKEHMTNRVDLYSTILAYFLVANPELQKAMLSGGKMAKSLLESGLSLSTIKEAIKMEMQTTKTNEHQTTPTDNP